MSSKTLEAGAVLALGTLLCQAALSAVRAVRAPERSLLKLAGPLVWLVLCLQALDAWPAGCDPLRFPSTALRMALPLLGVPWLIAGHQPDGSSGRHLLDTASRWLAALLSAVTLGAGVLFARHAWRSIGGVDFWSYVLFARDLASGHANQSGVHLLYFPGVYWFWRAALALGSGTTAGLQVAYLGALLANVALVTLLVWRATRSWFWPLVAAAWVTVLLIRLDGLEGCTEPLAGAAALLGLLAWTYGSESAAGLTCLGMGLGLALLFKQQGGLVSLGWFALLPAAGGAGQGGLRRLLLVPCAATLVALLGAQFAGGLRTLLPAITVVGRYQAEGNLLGNLLSLSSFEPSLAVGPALVAAAFVILRGQLSASLQTRLMGFALLAGLATLLQFTKRGYPHYALLTAPLFVVAGVLALSTLQVSWAGRGVAPVVRFALLALMGLGLTRLVARPEFSVVRSGGRFPGPWPEGTSVSRELPEVQRLIAPGSEILLLPPRRNALHFSLRTRSTVLRSGYYWGASRPEMALQAARDPRVNAVLVVAPSGADDEAACEDVGCVAAIAGLPALGYQRRYLGEALVLWQRPLSPGTP